MTGSTVYVTFELKLINIGVDVQFYLKECNAGDPVTWPVKLH